MALARTLGTFNGVVIGTILGLAAYHVVSGDSLFTIEGLLASKDIVMMAFFAASTSALATGIKPIPGVLGGIAGGLLAVPVSILFPAGLSLPMSAIGGFVGGLVVGRLPGLR